MWDTPISTASFTMQTLDQSKQYAILAASLPTAYITVNNGPNITLTSQSSDYHLAFTINKNSNDPTKWNICTCPDSPSLNFCMDQWGDNVTQAALQHSNYNTGQQWTLNGSLQKDGATFWQMQSEFAGPSRYLAIDGMEVGMLLNAARNATYWRLIESSSQSPSANISSTGISNISPMATAGSSSSPPTTSVAKSSTRSLSVGALVGLILAAIVFVLLALAGMMCFSSRRRKSRRRQLAINTLPDMGQAEPSLRSLSHIPRLKSFFRLGAAEVSGDSAQHLAAPSEMSSTTESRIRELDGNARRHELAAG